MDTCVCVCVCVQACGCVFDGSFFHWEVDFVCTHNYADENHAPCYMLQSIVVFIYTCIIIHTVHTGAPDVFTAFAAINGADDLALALGALSGASMFILTIVVRLLPRTHTLNDSPSGPLLSRSLAHPPPHVVLVKMRVIFAGAECRLACAFLGPRLHIHVVATPPPTRARSRHRLDSSCWCQRHRRACNGSIFCGISPPMPSLCSS